MSVTTATVMRRVKPNVPGWKKKGTVHRYQSGTGIWVALGPRKIGAKFDHSLLEMYFDVSVWPQECWDMDRRIYYPRARQPGIEGGTLHGYVVAPKHFRAAPDDSLIWHIPEAQAAEAGDAVAATLNALLPKLADAVEKVSALGLVNDPKQALPREHVRWDLLTNRSYVKLPILAAQGPSQELDQLKSELRSVFPIPEDVFAYIDAVAANATPR